jgi:hypothetical protein
VSSCRPPVVLSPLPKLPGLVVARGLLEDDFQSVEGVDDGDLADKCDELVIVVVLGPRSV